ncbi:hypothetical protein D3C77_810890 [compost metagenome]
MNVASYSFRHFAHMHRVAVYPFEQRIQPVIEIFIAGAAPEAPDFAKLGIGQTAFLTAKMFR